MARKQQPAAEAKAPDLPTVSPQEFHQEQRALVQYTAEMDAITEQYGIGIPYNFDAYVSAGRGIMAGLGTQLFELGRICLVIKEHEGHGRFQEAVESIGVAPRFAQKCMAAVVKFESSEGRKLIGARLTSSKLMELLAEDDDELEALAGGGSIAGKTLDEIDRMSVRELRAALRDEKKARAEDRESHEAILQRKDKKLNDLASKNRSQGKAPLRKKVEDRMAEINELALAHLSSGDTLRQALLDLNEVVEESGETLDADLDDQISGHIASIQTLVTNLAEIAGV